MNKMTTIFIQKTGGKRNVVSLINSSFVDIEMAAEMIDYPSEEEAAKAFVEYVRDNPRDAVTGLYSQEVLQNAGLSQWSTLSCIVEKAC